MTADRLFETTSIPGHLAPTPERLERLLSKQTLEELYEVEEQPFARGKYATVRRCRERSNGRQWAAKFLRKRRRAQELRAEALHEVAVLDAAAHCPRLVSLHEVFETNTEMVLVLELAPGGELQMVLDRDEVPEERQVARLLRQILDGIAFLHSFNVAHLDIKPQNLVLTGEFPECDVKLCDFGISRYISHGADIREILGTPDYVAPEVLNYEPISLATDMWSVGVLLYVLLSGCSPFGGDTKQETFCNISRCHLDFPDDLFEDVSETARDLMSKLMLKDPSERLTVTECLQHPWFLSFDDPVAPLSLPSSTMVTNDQESEPAPPPPPPLPPPTIESINQDETSMPKRSSSAESAPVIAEIEPETLKSSTMMTTSADNDRLVFQKSETSDVKAPAARVVTSHTENIYSKPKSTPMPVRIGLSPDRRDTFKRNMDSLAQKFSAGTEIVIIEQSTSVSSSMGNQSISGVSIAQRRATGTHTMPAGEVFKCTPVFILGEAVAVAAGGEHQCSDSGSDTVSEISTDSSSDRSSIYSDDSLDFILYGKTQGRASFPFAGSMDADRWDQQQQLQQQQQQQQHSSRHYSRGWPRECNGVVSKALSRFTTETRRSCGDNGLAAEKLPDRTINHASCGGGTVCTNGNSTRGLKSAGLEALRERGGNFVVIREPVRAGRYTRYSEVQCESVKARIRRFQVHGAAS